MDQKSDAPKVTIVGGGMITGMQILPTIYHMQRRGRLGDIGICALNAPPLRTLQEDAALAKAFPGQSFTPYPDPAKVADASQLRDDELPDMLDQFDTRQVCHVTYGSVLTSTGADGRPLFRDRLFRVLQDQEAVYHHRLEDHFRRHISAFV